MKQKSRKGEPPYQKQHWQVLGYIYHPPPHSPTYVLFQFLCNIQQYCNSEYNKLNSHKQKGCISITKLNCIGGKKIGVIYSYRDCTSNCTTDKIEAMRHYMFLIQCFIVWGSRHWVVQLISLGWSDLFKPSSGPRNRPSDRSTGIWTDGWTPWDKTPTGIWTDRWIDDSVGQDTHRHVDRQMDWWLRGTRQIHWKTDERTDAWTDTDRQIYGQADRSKHIYKNDINRYFLQSAVVSLTRVKLTVLYDSHWKKVLTMRCHKAEPSMRGMRSSVVPKIDKDIT